eukprot:7986595-Alexandrium_andersonii.AAC.1
MPAGDLGVSAATTGFAHCNDTGFRHRGRHRSRGPGLASPLALALAACTAAGATAVSAPRATRAR